MITKSIDIKDATILSTAGHPADPEPTTVLVISAPLTVGLADALKCRDMSFTLNDNPRQFEGKFGLPLELGEADAEIVLPAFTGGVDTLRPFKIWKFRIGHETDLQLGVEFRAHFKGAADAQVIGDLLQSVNQDPFTVSIVSLQGELFAEKAPETKGDGPAGGSRVDMSPVKGPLFEGHEGEGDYSGFEDPLEGEGDTTHFDASNEGEKQEAIGEILPIPDGQPNENGVYTCEPHYDLQFNGKGCSAGIDLLCIAPGQWISRARADTKSSGSFSAPLKANQIFPSLEMAVAWESFHAEAAARRSINSTGKTGAKAWLSITEWFHKQFLAQVSEMRLLNPEVLEGMILSYDSDNEEASTKGIPADPDAPERRTAEEIAAGAPHHIQTEAVQ
jgi:hypothetical protein